MLNSQTSSDFRKHSRSICKKDGRCSLAMVVIVASAKIPRKPSLRVVILLHSCFFFYTVSFISFFLWPWCHPPKGRARNQRSRQLCGERERRQRDLSKMYLAASFRSQEWHSLRERCFCEATPQSFTYGHWHCWPSSFQVDYSSCTRLQDGPLVHTCNTKTAAPSSQTKQWSS